jgi:hypothetical protein
MKVLINIKLQKISEHAPHYGDFVALVERPCSTLLIQFFDISANSKISIDDLMVTSHALDCSHYQPRPLFLSYQSGRRLSKKKNQQQLLLPSYQSRVHPF